MVSYINVKISGYDNFSFKVPINRYCIYSKNYGDKYVEKKI